MSRSLILAVGVSLFLFTLRLLLAQRIGFGDAEALYVSYALHPQPAYLDHPGLVGLVARCIGAGSAPSPQLTHAFTAVAATLFPWVGVLAARAGGAPRENALHTYFALALTPELAIGLFALTPDLLLAFFWVAALGAWAFCLRSAPGSFRALVSALAAGAFTGLACLSKVSGVLLGAGLVLALATCAGRPHLRTLAPWLGFGLAALLVAPVIAWEVENDFPMLRHRLVATQSRAGVSLRNLGSLVGGQLLYVTPPFLYAAYRVLRLVSSRRPEPWASVYWVVTWAAALPLAALCLWSRVAEPHWMAPAYLGIALGAAHVPRIPLPRACVATGVLAAILAFVWVGTDLPVRLSGESYVARYDIGNDLHAWQPGKFAVQSAIVEARKLGGGRPVVVGPHYVVCAQLEAAVGNEATVGCRTPIGDDFGRWHPEATWIGASVLLYAQDDRFETVPEREFPNHVATEIRTAKVIRAGRTVRTITVTRLEKRSDVAWGVTTYPGRP